MTDYRPEATLDSGLEKPAYLAHLSDEELAEQDAHNARVERNIKIGAGIVGGVLLLSVFSAVVSVANMDDMPPEEPATEQAVPAPRL